MINNGIDKIKIVAFDLDGTLLRGKDFKYSWQLIWKYLNYNDDIRVNFFREYEEEVLSYKDWCHKCISFFKQKHLTRSDFNKICQHLSPTKNLESTINILRSQKITTAIISGGINVFLEEKIENYKELFDYVYINKFHFDKNGFLKNVTPTKYDFEGKLDGLKLICQKEKCSLSNCVYIGEEKNDRFLIRYMREINQGITIAYPPTDTDVTNQATFRINENNLERILHYIL